MSAFDDILKSEQEAEELIAMAREEVARDIAMARDERKTRIEVEVERLNEAESVALKTHQQQIIDKTEEIQKKFNEEVLLVEKKFESHKSNLITTVKKKLS